MSMKLKEILDGIDDMPLYDKDFQIINRLLLIVDDKLFTKILEEVLEGNLFWSDFEKLLSNTNYTEILEKNLPIQDKLQTDISNLIKYRESLYGMIVNANDDKSITNIGMSKPDETLSPKQYEIYSEEYERVRNDLLYELTKISPDDNELSIACKIKLETAIRNGEILLKKIKEGDVDPLEDEFIKEIVDNGKPYDYINPDDIFFFIGSYILPIDYNRQILTSIDREFMSRNNISESEMKQIKSLSLFLRRETAIREDRGGS